MSVKTGFRIAVAAASLTAFVGLARAETDYETDYTIGPITLAGSYLAARSADAARDIEAAANFFTAALGNDPENPILMERVLVLRIANGDIEPAAGYAERLVDVDPRNPLARLLRGVRDIKSGDYAGAEAEMAETARAPLAVLTSGLLTAWAKQGAGDVDGALEVVDGLTGPSWYSIFKNYHTALIADVAGRHDLAIQAITDAFETDGSALRVVEAYGRILTEAGKRDQAIEALSRFMQTQPGNPVIGELLADLEAGRDPGPLVGTTVEGAAEVLYGLGAAIGSDEGTELPSAYLHLALYLKPEFNLALTALADLFVASERCEDAIRFYGQIPDDSYLRRNADIQTGFCLDGLARTDEAVALLNKVIDAKPEGLDAIMALGNILRGRERFAEAAEVYTKGIATIDEPGPGDWRIFYFRGVAYERSKEWDKAEADLKEALDLNPGQPQVLNYLGYSWVDMGTNLDEGLDMIRSAVDQRPNDGYIVDSLGWAYYRLGRYEDAVAQLERAVELRPEDPVINDHLGDAYWKVGRKLEATFQWNHARDLDPEPVDLEVIVKKLEKGLVTDGGSDG
ncbi:MAG: tetratricopeptide repeat protein [Bauldia sp.]|uniref:tetratricopeptide repeat protein n=1 Tax=Bauldia sp. TaxID=2575872 RepID=UPI001D64FA4B|nr:tetratricopeptide repeat protein [Bauldia sp.]MCB1494388.1 tetratricopeptide repeat protein [Bauldia sp.]